MDIMEYSIVHDRGMICAEEEWSHVGTEEHILFENSRDWKCCTMVW